jgi:glycosyltransferase involved in cell wall biosynthesis
MNNLVNLRVAIIHEYLDNLGGAERVLLQIIEMFPEADLFFLTYSPKKLPSWVVSKVAKHKVTVSFANRLHRFTPLVRMLAPKAIESFNLQNYDLVISNCNSYAKGVITPTSTLHISYIHSPTRYLWDYNQQYLDEHAKNGLSRLILRRLFFSQRQWDFVAARRPDFILANSQNIASRIKKYYGLESEVLYPGTNLNQFKPAEKENYFLVVSRLSAYKKIDLVVEAFRELPDLKLKIVGTGSELANLKKKAVGASNIQFLGFISEEELPNIYAKAKALIFPQVEDFGLVPIEAMASGTPVIAYEKGGALETITEPTGMFFHPQTAKALIRAIREFLNKEHGFTKNNLLAHAQTFSEEKFKENFQRIIGEALVKNIKEEFKRN